VSNSKKRCSLKNYEFKHLFSPSTVSVPTTALNRNVVLVGTLSWIAGRKGRQGRRCPIKLEAKPLDGRPWHVKQACGSNVTKRERRDSWASRDDCNASVKGLCPRLKVTLRETYTLMHLSARLSLSCSIYIEAQRSAFEVQSLALFWVVARRRAPPLTNPSQTKTFRSPVGSSSCSAEDDKPIPYRRRLATTLEAPPYILTTRNQCPIRPKASRLPSSGLVIPNV
jgi:hypothetical protein